MNHKTRKKIVMTVSNEFTTDYRVYREAKALVDAGFDVTIFCVYKPGLKRQENQEGIKVRRILDNYLRLPVFSESRRVRQVWWQALKASQADLYHAHDRDTLDLTGKIALQNKVPFVYDSHEFWPDKNRYEVNTGSLRDRLSTWWWNQKEKYYAPLADGLIMTSPGHAQGLVKVLGVQQPVLVRNVPEYQRGSDKKYLKNKFKLKDSDFLLVYMGNVQRKRGIEETIEALKYLPDHVHFIILGYGNYSDELKNTLPLKLKNRVHFHGPVHFRQIVPVICSADVGVAAFQANCYSHRHVLPNKIFIYMMAELAVAVSDFPDLGAIVKENHIGELFKPDDPQDLARVLNKFVVDKQYLEKCKNNSALASKNKYRWDIEKDNLLELYNSLLR